jgi:hypothetical protein
VVRWESTNLAISYDTQLTVVEQSRSRISQYMSENNREWNNSAVWIDKMEFQNAIHLVIAIEHEYPWVFIVVPVS